MKGKILLVDDNDDLLLITRIILKGQGYDTILARSLDEAEKKLRIHQPALLLLDINVGEEDGRPFCYELKNRAGEEVPRIILMSGNDCEAYQAAEADDFLPKPFDFNELIQKVEQQFLAEI